ncbi:MAG: DNA-processing protein DprA [Alphaproteobacteria bacterium]|nr:DNA-processing protein DprA [Alphaproteobacteria bacterium]
MNKEKLISYIQLINTAGIGPVNFKRLMDRYHDIDIALKELSQKKSIFPRQKAEKELLTAEIKGIKIITIEDDEYPYNLKQIDDCPPVLYALGNTSLLQNKNALAVVGSRSASFGASKLAQNISKEIAENGITIVSGMARGIDSFAHLGALETNASTIAVLGTGVDVVYPKENDTLYKKIIQKGLVLSEYPLGTSPQSSNFPRRNRIVSGLSKGVLVVEASVMSGSLITANLALEQGRDVYAIPGAPFDNRTSGCNKLIKEGATLVETSKDISDNFDFKDKEFISLTPSKIPTRELFEYSLDNNQISTDSANENNLHQNLLSLISTTGEDIDDIIRHFSVPTEEILMVISELELDGKIIRLPGNKIAKS